jgi:hypothetical protein
MLMGVAVGLRRLILSQGHRLRVYVPVGTAWKGYSLRRLKENPAIVRHVVAGVFRGNRGRLPPRGLPHRRTEGAAFAFFRTFFSFGAASAAFGVPLRGRGRQNLRHVPARSSSCTACRTRR